MAFFEFNALSVIMGGSFAARVFHPEMDKLALDDVAHEAKYPVLVLLHDEGCSAVDWHKSPAERLAAEHGIFIIAPDVQHALGTDMEYGPKYETFISGELLAICRNLFPISHDPMQTWIGGAGTGAFGAVKTALHHPDVFTKAFSLAGTLDLGAIIQSARAGGETGIHHTAASLEAVFGDLKAFFGGKNDLFALATAYTKGHYYFVCEENYARKSESDAIAKLLGTSAKTADVPAGADCQSYQKSMELALKWACAKEEN